VARDLVRGRERVGTDQEHLSAAIEWMCRAQDATRSGGVAGGYLLAQGWLPPYPETSGYIIQTFLKYFAWTRDERYLERAVRMGDWEVEIQLPGGAVRGGMGINDYPIVFNTGQVILGWTALYAVTNAERFLTAARRASDWLLDIQDSDGKWTKHNLRGAPRVYDTRVAWSLLEAYKCTSDRRYKQAAEKNITWALGLAQPNGWFTHGNIYRENRGEMNKPPLTHTIAYVLSGLVESLPHVDDDLRRQVFDVAQRASVNIMEYFETTRSGSRSATLGLPATLDRNWRSNDRFSCLTGNAQMAEVWFRLHELTGESRYRENAVAILDEVKLTQNLHSHNPGVRGGVAGSYPVWGDYIAFGYPNWAAKFFVDALFLKQSATESTRSQVGQDPHPFSSPA
jgi:uncharacterized protein YyaL (SSP411 family)